MNTDYPIEALEILLNRDCLTERYSPLIPYKQDLIEGLKRLGCKTKAAGYGKIWREKRKGGGKMNILADLFLSFSKIGAFTFGGGYAMLSLIEDHCVEKRHWITHDEMMNVTVIAESTPGPISINCATYVGYKQAGIPGAVLATLGVVLPSFLIIFLISKFLDSFLEIPLIAHAFQGIKLAVGLLILNAGVNMLKKTEKKPLPLCILLGSFVILLLSDFLALDFSSIALMLAAAAVSLCAFLLTKKHGKDGEGA